MFNTLLVAVDGSEHSFKALDLAADLAEKYDSELLLVSVYRHYSSIESTHSLIRARQIPEPPDETLKGIAKEVCNEGKRRAQGRGVKNVRTFVRRGPTARTIVDVAKEKKADALVMGSRGLGDVTGFLMGSVSHKVSSLAPCTVITVK